MVSNDEGLKQYAKENVITTEETGAILGRTRQQINTYARNNELVPFKAMKSGNLYWKPDVYEFAARLRKEHLKTPHKILGGGVTSRALEEIQDIDGSRVKEIFVFFSKSKAIRKGFYNLISPEMPDTLIGLDVPSFVAILDDDSEVWVDGINCGYGGSGPCGTESVFESWGVYNNSEVPEDVVSSSEVVHVYIEDGVWKSDSEPRTKYSEDEDFTTLLNERVDAFFYSFNGKLILAQSNEYHNIMDRFTPIKTETLLRYIDFIPNPVEVDFISEEDAKSSGHFSITYARTVYYQIVIKDMMDRELWLEYPFEKIDSEDQKNLGDVIEMLGLKPDENDKPKVLNQLKAWFSNKPRFKTQRFVK